MRKLQLFILCMLSFGAYAESITLNHQDVIKLALERNERSQISQATLERALEQISKAKSSLYPTLSLEYGVARVKNTPNVTPYSDNWNTGGKVSFSQPISTFGKLSAAIDLARAQKSQIENDDIATKASVKRIAETLFYSALFNKEVLRITKDSYQNTLKNKRALEKRVSFGRISRNENLKMQADVASRKPQYIEAEKNYQTSLIDLANFLALDPGTKVELSGNLESSLGTISTLGSSEDFENLALIRSLNQALTTSKANEQFTKANYYPNLLLYGAYAPSTLNEDFMSNKITKQENLTLGVKLVFDWPFGGEKINDVAISRIETKITELNVNSQKREVRSRYNDLLQQYNSLREKLAASTEAVKLAESSYTVALNSFANGSVSQTQLNDSELLLTQNKINHAQNFLQLQLLSAELSEITTEGVEGGKI